MNGPRNQTSKVIVSAYFIISLVGIIYGAIALFSSENAEVSLLANLIWFSPVVLLSFSSVLYILKMKTGEFLFTISLLIQIPELTTSSLRYFYRVGPFASIQINFQSGLQWAFGGGFDFSYFIGNIPTGPYLVGINLFALIILIFIRYDVIDNFLIKKVSLTNKPI